MVDINDTSVYIRTIRKTNAQFEREYGKTLQRVQSKYSHRRGLGTQQKKSHSTREKKFIFLFAPLSWPVQRGKFCHMGGRKKMITWVSSKGWPIYYKRVSVFHTETLFESLATKVSEKRYSFLLRNLLIPQSAKYKKI